VALARKLVDTKTELARAVDSWRAAGEPRPSREVTLDALYDQRIELLLAGRSGLARATLPARFGRDRPRVRTNLTQSVSSGG